MSETTYEQLQFIQKLKQAFQSKTDKYRTVLHFSQTQVLMNAKSIIWEMQKEITHKLMDLEKQIESYPRYMIMKQSQDQIELIVQVEQIIEQKKLIGDLPHKQMRQVASILDEGVDRNLQRWDEWREKNITHFIHEITLAKSLYKQFLSYELGNYIGVDEETGLVQLISDKDEEVIVNNNNNNNKNDGDNLLNKFKNMISGVVHKAHSYQKQRSRAESMTSSVKSNGDYEAPEHVHTFAGHQQQVYCCIQLTDESYITSSFDGTVKAWNRDDYRIEYSSPPIQTSYNDIIEITNHKLDQNTFMFASANDDGTIKVFVRHPQQNWELYKELPHTKEGSPFHLAYDEKYNLLLYNTLRNGKMIQIYDMATFKVSQQVHSCIKQKFPHKFTQSSCGTCISLLPTDQRFITADISGFIYKWSYTSKQPLVKFRAHENCINSITVLNDFRIATCCQNAVLKLWSGSLLGNKPLSVYTHKFPLWSLCATQNFLLSGDVEGFISYHCLDTLEVKKTIKAHTSGIFMMKGYEGTLEKTFTTSSEDFKAKAWTLS